jgi:hypothetical protein
MGRREEGPDRRRGVAGGVAVPRPNSGGSMEENHNGGGERKAWKCTLQEERSRWRRGHIAP